MLVYISLVELLDGTIETVDKETLRKLGFESLDAWWRKTARISVNAAIQAALSQSAHRLLATQILVAGTRKMQPGVEPIISALVLLGTSNVPEVRGIARGGLKAWKHKPEIFFPVTQQGKDGKIALRALGMRSATLATEMDREVLRDRWKQLLNSQ